MPDKKKATRKLRAIPSADVKGYSLLMANDEAFTIQALIEYRDIMSAQIQQNNGRVVDAPGDNLLAEFSIAVDAVECAIEIQKELKKQNNELPDDKKLQFRIGVNIGDVVQDGERLYGDGVNIAARIEGLADAGGVLRQTGLSSSSRRWCEVCLLPPSGVLRSSSSCRKGIPQTCLID